MRRAVTAWCAYDTFVVRAKGTKILEVADVIVVELAELGDAAQVPGLHLL
ncbi:hypothetical protein [Streptomyces cyaneofuscatus]